jgi:hypothetical protein
MRIALLLTVVVGVCSVTISSAAEPAANQQPGGIVGRQLVEMFQTGFGRGANPLKEARRHYDAARSEAKGDPRVDYAFGLVLLKQLRSKEALAQFESVTKSAPDYWPGWEALIWCHFAAKDHAQGYSQLKEFARRLADSRSDLVERQASAEWVGQVIAAVQKSADTIKQREALLREDEALKEIFGPELQPSYTGGKAHVNSLHSMLEEDVQQTRETMQARQEKERAEKEVEVAKDLEASAEKRESLKKSAEELKKSLDEQVANFDKQLSRLEKDYDFLQKRLVSIAASQLQLNNELTLLDQPANKSKGSLAPQAIENRKAALGMQQLKYQVEADQSLAATMLVSQKAQAVVLQKVAAIRQYEKATGQLVQTDASLDKWQGRLKKEGEKLKSPPKGKPAPVANKINQARSFRTYVDLDLVLERDRVLDSFSVAIPEPNSSK